MPAKLTALLGGEDVLLLVSVTNVERLADWQARRGQAPSAAARSRRR